MKIKITLFSLFFISHVFSQNIKFSDILIEKSDGDISEFKVIDFDNDGDDDIMLPTFNDYGNGPEIKWYENINGEYHEKYIANLDFSHVDNPNTFPLGTLKYFKNSSGLWDIFHISNNSFYIPHEFEIYRYKQIATGVFQKEIFFSGVENLLYSFEILDINNDSLVDLVSFEFDANNTFLESYDVNLRINNGNGFTLSTMSTEIFGYIQISDFYRSVYADFYIVDMNSDGFDDVIYINNHLVGTNTLDDSIIYFKNNTDSTFSKQQLPDIHGIAIAFSSKTHILNFNDNNQDGLIDIHIPTRNPRFNQPEVIFQDAEDSFTKRMLNFPVTGCESPLKYLFPNPNQSKDIISVPIFTSFFQSYCSKISYMTYDTNSDSYTKDGFIDIKPRFGTRITDAKIVDANQDNRFEYILSQDNNLIEYSQEYQGGPYNGKFLGEELTGEFKQVISYNFNNDSHRDLLAISTYNNALFLYINQESSSFYSVVIDATDDLILGAGETDMNNDNLMDILALSSRSNNETELDLYWYENISSNTFNKQYLGVVPISFNILNNDNTQYEFKDLDHDNDLDIVITSDSAILWSENNDNNYLAPVIILRYSANYDNDITFVDFDKDGDTDLVASYCKWFFGCSHKTEWMEMTPAGYVQHILEEDNSNEVFAPIDLDNNGKMDFLVLTRTGERFIWIANNSGYQIIPFDGFYFSSDLKVIDINNDGLQDVIQNNKLYLNQGNLQFIEQMIPYGGIRNINTDIVDVNNDGLLDVLYYPNGNRAQLRILKQAFAIPTIVPLNPIMLIFIIIGILLFGYKSILVRIDFSV